MSTERDNGAVVVDPLGGLILDPSTELKFKGPFDDYVTVSLTIKNPTDKRIAFKIKTTAPKRYCVKPNSGVLDPANTMKVNVLLQPFTYDPNEKNKHKFMVQYMYLTESEMNLTVNDILNMWKDVPASRLLDLKLRCSFEFTEAEQQKLSQLNVQSNDTTSINTKSNNSSSTATITSGSTSQSDSAKASTTTSQQQAKTSNPNDNSLNTESSLNNTLNDFQSYATTKQTNNSLNNSNKASAAAVTSTGSASIDKNDNLVNELKLVKQENDQLKKEVARLKEEEGRLRKLALQAPSGSSSAVKSGDLGNGSLEDLLQNRLLILVFVLFAIIVYLLLFR